MQVYLWYYIDNLIVFILGTKEKKIIPGKFQLIAEIFYNLLQND